MEVVAFVKPSNCLSRHSSEGSSCVNGTVPWAHQQAEVRSAPPMAICQCLRTDNEDFGSILILQFLFQWHLDLRHRTQTFSHLNGKRRTFGTQPPLPECVGKNLDKQWASGSMCFVERQITFFSQTEPISIVWQNRPTSSSAYYVSL